MNKSLKKYITLAFNDELDLKATKEAFNLIMSGDIGDIQISSFLSLLQKSGIKAHHVIGAKEVMKSKMLQVKAPTDSIDTCGTGGDGKGSLNISTAVAFVLASKGIPVAKHGNRALTSKCGSADVLEALNIRIDIEISKIEQCLEEIGICFMLAPNHHPAMKFVGSVRKELGFRTIFNMLGPLLNPASVKNQIVGVYSKNVFDIYKNVFEIEHEKNICLISGYDGNDEISLDGKNTIFTNKNGTFEFDPRSIDLPKSKENELSGGDAKYNAQRILELFNGKIDSFYHSVCINSAFGILTYKSSNINFDNINEALEEARQIINSKAPLQILEKLSKFTNS